MSRQALLDLLRERIGLEAAAMGERVLDGALAEARAALAVRDDETLYRRAVLDREAFQEVVERCVVPESWFFRARDQYADLVRHARARPDRRPYRVLSLPCAGGEEAWSAVIALLEAGLPPGDIDVLGVDVSRAAVRRAQAATYTSNALRGCPLPEAWVEERPLGFAIASTMRTCARFRVGNVLEPMVLAPGETFDAIFCRNLLIYLHAGARTRLLDTLVPALDRGGLLLAGQAEILGGSGHELEPCEGGSPLTYVRAATPRMVPRTAPLPPPESAAATLASALVPPAAPLASGSRPSPAPAPAPVNAPSPSSSLSPTPPSPRELADLGRLEEARAACRAALEQRPEDVETLFVLGLVESARSDLAAADDAFARVGYLDRDHAEALDHRVALAERQGRTALARELRGRSERIRLRLRKQP